MAKARDRTDGALVVVSCCLRSSVDDADRQAALLKRDETRPANIRDASIAEEKDMTDSKRNKFERKKMTNVWMVLKVS